MPHARMFDEDDPTLARLEELCLGFPDAKMKASHGRPAFYTTKVFAYYGGSIKVDGSYVQHGQSLVFLPAPDEAEALAQDERIYRPAYLGAYGWLGLGLGPDPDWDEVAELVEESFRLTATRAAIAALDAR